MPFHYHPIRLCVIIIGAVQVRKTGMVELNCTRLVPALEDHPSFSFGTKLIRQTCFFLVVFGWIFDPQGHLRLEENSRSSLHRNEIYYSFL